MPDQRYWMLLPGFLVLCLNQATGWAQSSLGRALLFDGVDDHVTATAPALPTGNTPYTIEAWVRPEAMTPGGIVSWGNTPPRQLNALRLTASGFENSWAGSHVLSAVIGPLTDGWHHLAATHDGTTRRLYLDGVQVASDTPAAHNVTTTGNFTIGRDGSSFFKGTVDDLRVWNVARNVGQIQTNRWRRLASSEPGLVANFEFDEVAGTLTRDSTTNRFRGQLGNRVRRVPSLWWPVPVLNGPNPMTNAHGTPFVDPGVTIPGGALAVAIGGQHSAALKNDGTVVAWGYSPTGETIVPPTATNVIALACGISHNLALRRDGSLVAWGGGTTWLTNIPPEATNIVAIAAGTWHNLALTANGNPIGWGRNVEGQLNVPPGATNLVGIAAGANHSLGLRSDGTVIGWGTNYSGEVTIPASATNVIAIAAGHFHSVALRADGTVVAWGLNNFGQTNVPASATNVMAVDANSYRSLAVRADGSLISWGGYYVSDNTYAATVTNVLMASSGWDHMLAVRRDGTMLGWGSTVYLQTTIPTNMNRLDVPVSVSGSVDVNTFGPYLLTYNVTNSHGATGTTNRLVQVLPPRPEVVTLPATGKTNSAATLNGTVNPRGAATTTWFEWGFTTGYGSNTLPTAIGSGTIPVLVSFSGTNFPPGVVIHYRAVADNGSGVTKGLDQSFWVPRIHASASAPLTNECHTPFVNPAVSVRGNPLAIAANGLWSVGLQADGRIAAWGNNTYGQININTASANTNFIAVDAGYYHGLALRVDGTVFCWGRNNYGQTNVPSEATNVVAISAGDHFNLALRADGSIIGWGLNTYGQATAPAAATNVVAISAGSSHSLALRADGTVVAWGDSYSSETIVPTNATNVIAIAAGGTQSLAVRCDGTMLAWGDKYYGQISVPADATNVIAVSAGWFHSVALRADGSVRAWGRNNLGELNVPTSATNVIAIAAGSDHNVAMRADGSMFGWGYGAYGQTASFSPTLLNLPVTISGSVDENVPGTYSLTYLITNLSGGMATASRTVTVTDTLPPTLSLLGENPLVLAVGEVFVDPGAGATDLCGGDVTAGIVASGFVDTAAAGTYPRTYTATDAFGNAAAIQRTVIVGLPTAATLLPAVVSDTAATLNGYANPRGVAATAWFEWGLSPTYGNQTPPISVGTGVVVVPVNAALNGLNPALNYHYRLVVSNSVGVVWGQDQTIWWPALRLNGANVLTNQCHVSFVDPATVNAGPVAIATGSLHSLALKPSGTVAAWGMNFYGQTGVPAGLTNAVAITAGNASSFALRADGTVIGWGTYGYGETNVPAGLAGVIAISAGSLHVLALRSGGTVVAWGYNEYGETNVPGNAINVEAIAAGSRHSLALKADGSVVAWGLNDNGQAIVPPDAINIRAIAAGAWHNLALRSDGTLLSWGYNYYGQTNIPPAATNVVAIAAGETHSLALRADGTIVAWGNNNSGQLNVPATATNIVAIAAGGSHSLALRADGGVVAWGYNYYGQAGVPSGLSTLNLPVAVSGSLDVNVPGTYVLNYNVTNALGATATTNRTVVVVDTLRPVLTLIGANSVILPVGGTFTDFGATATDLCAGNLTASIVTTGSVDPSTPGSYTRTYTVTDPVGNTAQTNRTVLVGFPQANTFSSSNLLNQSALLSGVVNPRGADTAAWFEWGPTIAYTGGRFPVAVGDGTSSVSVSAPITGLTPGVLYHSRLVASNAAGISRGENRMFWLPGLRPNGLAQVTNQCHVAYADAGTRQTALVAVAGGNNHSLLLRADGRVHSWGYGQAQTNTPSLVTNAVAIAGGGYFSLALRRDGSVIAWGQSAYGETAVPAAATNLVAVAASGYNCLGLRADGTPVGWGNYYYGQPTVPASATNGIGIACGNWHNLLVRRDGTVIAWGNNTYGQTNVPAAATNVVAVEGGEFHSLALRADGRVIAWGQNSYGLPNVPTSATNIIAISSGAAHNLALRADGRVFAWGNNSSGQVNVPAAATNIIAIGAGTSHSFALRADGAVFGWGLNSYGQTTTNGLLPLNLPITTVNSVDPNTPGSYTVSYAVTNSFGGVATTNRTVIVADTLKPILTLLGVNPSMLRVGTPFTEPGATATDLCAGDLTSGISFGGTVDHDTPGSYTRTYSVTDPTGQVQIGSRTVVVVTTPALNTPTALDGTFRFTLTNTPGARFSVYATTNLTLANWTFIGPMVENPAGNFHFSDPVATNWASRFYRVTCP